MSLALLVLRATADPVEPAGMLDTPGASCVCRPAPCAERVDHGLLSGRDCREAEWSCFDEPVGSCAALVSTPVRVGIGVRLVSLLSMKPKCERPLDIDIDIESTAAVRFFGQTISGVCDARRRLPPTGEGRAGRKRRRRCAPAPSTRWHLGR
jgi:hypothetical protein